MTSFSEHSLDTEALWRELHERLGSFIRGRVATREDAEDLLQEVFARIHANAHRLTGLQSISGWVYRITRNAVIDFHRRRGVVERIARELSQTGADPAATSGKDAERRPARELARCLEPLMQGLPNGDRRALELTELEGLTQKRAAEKMGLTTSGMKSRVQRGRAKLKGLLLDCCHVELDRRQGILDYRQRQANCTCDCRQASGS